VPVLFIIGIVVFRQQLSGLFHYTGNWHAYKDKLPFFLFLFLAIVLTLLTFIKKLSLIPVLGLLSCFYLMTELGYTNWLRFLIWLAVGLIVYFTYSYKHSRMGKRGGEDPARNDQDSI